VELAAHSDGESFLASALAPARERYDYAFIDCPPSLGPLTVNALAAADRVLVPVQCEYYALEGLAQLLHSIELVRARLNPRLALAGMLLTMVDARTRLAADVAAEVRRHFGELVFDAVVPRSVRLAEAPSHGLPITFYDPASAGADAYYRVASELVDRS
jgi:chromosome partitioning protein